jgi:hypothetical protein
VKEDAGSQTEPVQRGGRAAELEGRSGSDLFCSGKEKERDGWC